MESQNIDYVLKIEDKYGLSIEFDSKKPEKLIKDRSLFGIEDEDLIKDIKAKPFIVKKDMHIRVSFENELYEFVIEKGFCYDGATIPCFAWWIIGQKTEPRFKLASCVHDWLCENHADIGNNRVLSTHIFITLCDVFGQFNKIKRFTMSFFINVFQMLFCGWGKR